MIRPSLETNHSVAVNSAQVILLFSANSQGIAYYTSYKFFRKSLQESGLANLQALSRFIKSFLIFINPKRLTDLHKNDSVLKTLFLVTFYLQ